LHNDVGARTGAGSISVRGRHAEVSATTVLRAHAGRGPFGVGSLMVVNCRAIMSRRM
jgi:hypothetical protein